MTRGRDYRVGENSHSGNGRSSETARPSGDLLDPTDIRDSLILGFRDLRLAPLPGLWVGTFFAVGGIEIYLLVSLAGFFFLTYPLAAGFALLGPFAAVMLYEVSRRLEMGLSPSFSDVLAVTTGSGAQSVGWMPMLNLFVFIVWIDVAAIVFVGFFGLSRPELGILLQEVFGTAHGLMFLMIGNAIGAVFAIAVFASSVVAYPLLLDRDTDFVTAIAISWRVVLANPFPMLGYGLIVGALTFLALLPGLLGLIVVLPLLGHSTWHLYRRVVRWPEPGTP